MKTLTGADRIFMALELQEPDRVPHFELTLDSKVKEAILPGASYDEAVEYFDWDAVVTDEEDQPTAVKPENYVEMVKVIHEHGKYPISI